MENIKAWLTKARESLKTWSGWLDLAAAALGGLISMDPTVAMVAGEFLPEYLQPFYTIAWVLVFFVLPKLARKKDKEAVADGE